MNAYSKSKIRWFFGLFLRLALVTGTVCLLFILLQLMSPHWKLRLFGGHHLFWFVGIVLLAGYTWAVHFGFPFFPLRSHRWRLIFSAILASVLVAACYATVCAAFLLLMSSGMGAWFVSPMAPVNRILFVDAAGFLDRDFYLFAEARGQKARFVARLDETGYYRLSNVQWTKDGQVVVCSLILLGGISDTGHATMTEGELPTAAVIAYDFSVGQTIAPSWLAFDTQGLEAKESSWREFEPAVQKLAAAHGGLTRNRITDDIVRSKEKLMMFWQIPQVP
jgi:hypothetical protein